MKPLKKIHMLSVFSLVSGNSIYNKEETTNGRNEETTEGENIKLPVSDLREGKLVELIHDGQLRISSMVPVSRVIIDNQQH